MKKQGYCPSCNTNWIREIDNLHTIWGCMLCGYQGDGADFFSSIPKIHTVILSSGSGRTWVEFERLGRVEGRRYHPGRGLLDWLDQVLGYGDEARRINVFTFTDRIVVEVEVGRL